VTGQNICTRRKHALLGSIIWLFCCEIHSAVTFAIIFLSGVSESQGQRYAKW
jgi:hypothetical protein